MFMVIVLGQSGEMFMVIVLETKRFGCREMFMVIVLGQSGEMFMVIVLGQSGLDVVKCLWSLCWDKVFWLS